MKKITLFLLIGLSVSVLIMLMPDLLADYPNLQIKIGFLGKIGLIVGLIGLWLFVILPNWGKPSKS